MKSHDSSRRKFVKTAAYVAPAILSLKATSAVAKSGSGNSDDNDDKPGKVKPRKPKKNS